MKKIPKKRLQLILALALVAGAALFLLSRFNGTAPSPGPAPAPSLTQATPRVTPPENSVPRTPLQPVAAKPQLPGPGNSAKVEDDTPVVDESKLDTYGQEQIALFKKLLAVQDEKEGYKDIMQGIKEANVYPPGTRPFEADADPVVNLYKPEIRRQQDPDNPNIMLVFSADRPFYKQGDMMTITAQLLRKVNEKAEKISAKSLEIKIYTNQTLLKTFALTPDDKLNYSLKLPTKFNTENFDGLGIITVQINVQTLDADGSLSLSNMTYVTVSPDFGAFTGKYRDAVVNKNLEISAQVNIKMDGNYYFESTLYTNEGQPVLVHGTTVELKSGAQWVTFKYAGYEFNSRKLDGPYVLKHVDFARAGVMPMQRLGEVNPNYSTQEYQSSEFTSEKYIDFEKIEQAAKAANPSGDHG